MHTACTLCTLCTLFKTGQTTENKTLEFRSRKGGDGIRPFKLTGIRRESLKLGRKGGAFNVWIKCACAQIKCAWTKLKCANSVHALQVWFFVQEFHQGNELSLTSMTFLLLQNTVRLKSDWNTLQGMHKVCYLFAKCMLQVCICRLNAHFFSLHYWVCIMSAQIVCIKCAFAYLVHTILDYTQINT